MHSLVKLLIVWLFLVFFAIPLLADEDDEAKERSANPNAAIQAFCDEGIKLSEKAEKTIGLKTEAAKGNGPIFEVPLKSLVYHQSEIGIYRQREEWFKLIDVEVLSKTGSTVKVKSAELKSDDQIVIDGAAFLRVAEISAKSGIESEGL